MTRVIRTPEELAEFVEHLLDPERPGPVVALTSRAGDQDPAFDPGEVRARLGEELDLWEIPTGQRTFELGDALGKQLGVFGGAARIWWPGLTTGDRPLDHPLIFDRHGVYGSQALERLVGAFEKGRVDAPTPSPTQPGNDELLARRTEGLEHANARLLRQLEEAQEEADKLDARARATQERLRAAEKALRAAEKALRAADRAEPASTVGEPRAEDGLYRAIVDAWLGDNHSAKERSAAPLRSFVLGHAFAASVENLGVEPQRVARVCAWVLDGRAEEMRSLAVHKLRTGSGGEDPQRQRGDRALAWRVNLKVNTPGAPRLHYWTRVNGVIEFASVNHHDDHEVPD